VKTAAKAHLLARDHQRHKLAGLVAAWDSFQRSAEKTNDPDQIALVAVIGVLLELALTRARELADEADELEVGAVFGAKRT